MVAMPPSIPISSESMDAPRSPVAMAVSSTAPPAGLTPEAQAYLQQMLQAQAEQFQAQLRRAQAGIAPATPAEPLDELLAAVLPDSRLSVR